MSDSLRFLAQRALAADTLEETSAELWAAFIDGSFKLVDRFEDDGRCYLVALRCDRRDRSDALCERERIVLERRARGELLESIAVDLGVSVSAVSRRLQRGMRKLGIATQAELLRIWALGCAQSSAR